jgi:predicted ATP-binding protein involved in virulence
MNATATLRLDRVHARNFRCFAECEVELHPTLTVFVAENGRGKTAILDALACALAPLVEELSGVRQWGGVAPSDVRLVPVADGEMTPVVPVEIGAQGVIDGQRLHWGMSLNGVGKFARTSSRELRGARAASAGMRARLDEYAHEMRDLAPPLPLVAFYGTGWLWAEQRLTEGRRRRDPTPLGRLAGYKDCLSSASSFKAFAAWYEDMARAASNRTKLAFHRDESPASLLAAVRDATRTVLAPTGWREIDCRLPPRNESGNDVGRAHLVVEHPTHGRLHLSQLSDGVRNMVALVADIAHRCARLNPQFGELAAKRTPGVLLIDEIDMHLHPGWQQKIAGLLRTAFPAMQLVLTTHSPQVLTTVDASCIRILEVERGVGDLETPTVETLGVESADVLARIMRVNAIPDVEAARKLSRYKALIQQGAATAEEAASLRTFLDAHFGARHPLMVECQRLLRLQALKVRPPAGGQP